MRRIGLAVVLALSLFGLRTAEAQVSGKVPTIGLLSSAGRIRCGFRGDLRQLAYVRGVNIMLESPAPRCSPRPVCWSSRPSWCA
jgi:hypothetical protein